MKKVYIKPDCFSMAAESVLLVSNSEPEVTGNIGAKENETVFFDDAPFGSLWEDDPAEDPFAIGD